MIRNELLMQFQADILDRPVVAARIAETSALGAAYAAGLAVGFWDGLDELRAMDRAAQRWEPAMDEATRVGRHRRAGTRASSGRSAGSIRRAKSRRSCGRTSARQRTP